MNHSQDIPGMIWNAASLTTPLLVSVVSIGRLAAVYLPLKYDKIFTSPVVYTMLIYCWLHGVAASSLSLWGDTGDGNLKVLMTCFLNLVQFLVYCSSVLFVYRFIFMTYKYAI